MTRVGISSQLLVEILNLDHLLLSVAGLGVITTRVMAVTVVQAAAVHSRMALLGQGLWAKEILVATPVVEEVAQLAAAAAVLAVWALRETQPKGKVVQVLQLQSLELQLRMQAVAVAVVGQ